jgi:hypothetical protein
MKTRQILKLGGVLFFLVVIIFYLSYKGVSSRHILNEHIVYKIERPSDAFRIWKERAVKGRSLIFINPRLSIPEIFQNSVEMRFSMMKRELVPLNDSNFLIHAIINNQVRRIYYIVPDEVWDTLKKDLGSNRAVSVRGQRLRVTIDGVPLIIERSRDFKSFYERHLVYINSSVISAYEQGFINRLITDKGIADIVIISN